MADVQTSAFRANGPIRSFPAFAGLAATLPAGLGFHLFHPKVLMRTARALYERWPSEAALDARFSFAEIETTDSLERLKEMRGLLDELVSDHDWISLADVLEEWDQSRAETAAGYSLVPEALEHLSVALSDGILPAGSHRPDPVPAVSDATAEFLEDIAADHPRHYALAALCAYLRVQQGRAWHATGPAQSALPDRWQFISRTFARTARLLEPHDPAARNSPLLAQIRFELLAFAEDPVAKLHRYHAQWSALNPRDLFPHMRYGHALLPYRCGDHAALEKSARQAALRTEAETGMAAYAGCYWQVMQNDPGVLIHSDVELLIAGLRDMLRLRAGDQHFVAELVQLLQSLSDEAGPDDDSALAQFQHDAVCGHLGRFLDEVVEQELTAILPAAWSGGLYGGLRRISRIRQAAWEDGAHFVIDARGLRCVPHGAAPATTAGATAPDPLI